jgi:hypothetical protein
VASILGDLLALQRDGRSQNEILAAMKGHGLTISQAIKISMELFDVGLGEAKSIVVSHPSWSQTAQAAEPFQEALVQAFREIESPKS